ncbi:MAG: hypothetical protein JNL73_06400 [Anaerolineales bacterium]|nr:hypothetical protein [Anaerolineales bacterium]
MTDIELTLRRHLIAVEPDEGFRRRLRAELLAVQPRAAASPASWLWLLAGVGGALSLASLAVVAARRGPAWVARIAPRRGASQTV